MKAHSLGSSIALVLLYAATATHSRAQEFNALTQDGADTAQTAAMAILPATRALPMTAHHKPGIHWGRLIKQEFFFLGVQQSFRLATEAKTRRALDGNYFQDWFYIVEHVRWNRWSDGDKWFTSDLAHPAQGAVTAWIYRDNDDYARGLEFNMRDPRYRKMLLKSFVAATVAEFWFKLGPFSEATVGHVGLHTNPQNGENRTGLNDYVTDEAIGVPIMMGEDWIDRFVTAPIERRTSNRSMINALRMLASPTRTFANLMSFQAPWHRDSRA
jgi:hypothetical protein